VDTESVLNVVAEDAQTGEALTRSYLPASSRPSRGLADTDEPITPPVDLSSWSPG
jgi:hypothetical protein